MNCKNRLTSEFGTKIFAYFNLVLVVLLSLLTYGFGGYYMVFCAAFVGTDVFLGAFGAFFALLFFGPMIALIFSTLLFVGVKKEKPKYILAYFVYGIVVIFLTTIATFLLMFVSIVYTSVEDETGLQLQWFSAAILLCGLAVYGAILFMIGKVYRQLQKAKYEGFKCISPKMNF